MFQPARPVPVEPTGFHLCLGLSTCRVYAFRKIVNVQAHPSFILNRNFSAPIVSPRGTETRGDGGIYLPNNLVLSPPIVASPPII